MKLHKVLSISFVIPLASTLILFSPQQAQADCGWLDPTCVSGPDDCLFGGCHHQAPSTVGEDQTPPRVRSARNLISRGYTCWDVNEYPAMTCPVPSGMRSSEFRVAYPTYASLGSVGEWSWNCLNQGHQLWGYKSGSQVNVICQPGMR
jgi:hypothetical protein